MAVDLTVLPNTRDRVQDSPVGKRITLIEGDSSSSNVTDVVRREAADKATVMVLLDSDHTRDHVAAELEAYAPLVTAGSYLVVFDTFMEVLADAPHGRPSWGTDNPAAAVRTFLGHHPEFEIDRHCERLLPTSCPGGFLRRMTQ